MKNLLIGLLMLVTTNIMAEAPTPPPAYKVTSHEICNNGLLYQVSQSKIHIQVVLLHDYHKLLKKWVPTLCTGA